MADDEDPGFILPIPEGMREQLQAHMDQQAMAGEVWRHEVRAFLDSLSLEQITTFKAMLRNLSDHESAVSLANYWEGMVTVVIDLKHGVCFGCGKDHEENLNAMGQEVADDG